MIIRILPAGASHSLPYIRIIWSYICRIAALDTRSLWHSFCFSSLWPLTFYGKFDISLQKSLRYHDSESWRGGISFHSSLPSHSTILCKTRSRESSVADHSLQVGFVDEILYSSIASSPEWHPISHSPHSTWENWCWLFELEWTYWVWLLEFTN